MSPTTYMNSQLCDHVNIVDLTFPRRYRQPILAQPVDMKLNGLPNLRLDLFDRYTSRHASRQVGNIRGVVAFCFFDDYCVSHTTSLESRLLQDAVQCARREIVAWLAGNSHAARLFRVFELAMAASRCYQEPPVLLQQSEGLADFHF